jgi:hypothetical protein
MAGKQDREGACVARGRVVRNGRRTLFIFVALASAACAINLIRHTDAASPAPAGAEGNESRTHTNRPAWPCCFVLFRGSFPSFFILQPSIGAENFNPPRPQVFLNQSALNSPHTFKRAGCARTAGSSLAGR